MITVPIFTRIMSTSEIGMVNLYNSLVFFVERNCNTIINIRWISGSDERL